MPACARRPSSRAAILSAPEPPPARRRRNEALGEVARLVVVLRVPLRRARRRRRRGPRQHAIPRPEPASLQDRPQARSPSLLRTLSGVVLQTGSLIGNYQIEALLGQGGMGVVYEAIQLSLHRRVALKVITPELSSNDRFQERFRREARSQAALDHPNVVTVHDFGDADGQLYISMQLIEGRRLKDLVARGELDLSRVVRVVAADRRRAGHRARRRDDPPRLQAAEHPGRQPRPRLPGGLRAHAGARRAGPHAHGPVRRHARLHRARSRSTAGRRPAAATSTRSAPCCSSASRAASHTSASRMPRSCSPTSPSPRRARARSAPTCRARWTRCSNTRWRRTPSSAWTRRAR